MINLKNRRALNLGLVVIGFGIGWTASALIKKVSDDNRMDGLANASSASNWTLGKASNASTPGVPESNKLLSQANNQSESDSLDQTAKLAAENNLIDLIMSESAELEITVARIIEYYKLVANGGAVSRSPRKNKRLRKFLRESPELNYALIDRFSSIEDSDIQNQLGLTLMINNSMQKPFLEPMLMEKIRQSEDRSQMLKLLGDWGLQSKSNLEYLRSELPYMDDAADVASAINAISRSSWVRRSALEPSVMGELRQTVAEMRGSESAEIRAAAVSAWRSIPGSDYRQTILDSFNDDSELVRNAALQVYTENPFKSSDFENTLLSNMQNESYSYKERFSIAHSLQRLNISAEQMKIVKRVQLEMNNYVKTLSPEEQEALFR